ncbi:MAG TPA: hypothetical protein VMB21_21275 [Candidatus Limnocylindria bacterium]|nr:hypothetical protein [Candidatus Limnocylindria bacterium]
MAASARAAIRVVAFSPDSQLAASGGRGGDVKVWSVGTGELLRSLPAHSRGWFPGVLALGFSPDGHWLLSGSSDHTLKLWEVPAGVLARTFIK